jgi:hypothetical protein
LVTNVLTVKAMVAMGPWTLSHVDDLGARVGSCQRCSTKIRYVWVMLLEQNGLPAEEWRIGSECGPRLEGMSQSLWDSGAELVERRLKLALRVAEAMRHPDFGRDVEHGAANILRERLPLLLDGTLPLAKQKHLSLVTGAMLNRLKRR